MPRVAADEGNPEVAVAFRLLMSDNPLLVAELLKSRKGKLRHARLATLATIGLLAELRAINGELPAQSGRRTQDRLGNEVGDPVDLTADDVVEVG